MSVNPSPSNIDTLAGLTEYAWSPQPAAANLVHTLLDECLRDCQFAANLSNRMLNATGTRLVDWLDHFGLPANHPTVSQLPKVGYELVPQSSDVWEHRAGLLPRIRVHSGAARNLAIKVESVVDFLTAHRLSDTEIVGPPFAAVRTAKVASNGKADENQVEVWIVERHGSLAFAADPQELLPLAAILRHSEAFRLRRRDYERDEEGYAQAFQLVESAIIDLGRDRTCELFFAAEREYWLHRNRAGQIQKARQDTLGLGWANHDHHTYRSSRHCFSLLIAFLERLGFVCRERFYAGREAGWGAQVIEHPVTGVTIFADVDLSPEEVSHDFAHQSLSPRNELGTVGLWCALHGEAFLQAGMHHLECQFDFSATREQLKQAGIETMPPFTDYPYLKQAFTKGEIWPVRTERVEHLRDAKLINAQQAQQFLTHGALGSHMEILQRNDGYKGFNQAGINQIIAATDPRRASVPESS
ncbi:MAG: hypothetical protein JWM11_6095 [Planctomycetaceae bacterium]|nr:hypothetical protein [Planctomycetaceae bacterium]